MSKNDSWFMVDNKRETSNPRGDRLFANSTAAETSEPGAQVNFLTNGFQITGSSSGTGQTNSNGHTYLYLAIAADPSTTTPSLANSFNTTLWSNAVGQHQSPITGVGFKPDLTWIKMRNAGTSHVLTDSVRGVTKTIFANDTDHQYTYAQGLTAFNDNGFALGNDSRFNSDERNAVSWNWKAGGTPSINTDGSVTSLVSANQAAGFSVVSFSNNNSTTNTFGHGLGSQPELVIIKSTSIVAGWFVYVDSLGKSKRLQFDGNPQSSWSSNDGWNTATGITPSVLSFAYSGTSYPFIAYCFASKSGYSKVGTYNGSGSANKQIATGFQPSFLMIKNITNTGSTGWAILDTARGGTTGNGKALFANLSGSEWTNNTIDIDFTATGFTIQNSYVVVNGGSDTYIYLAIA